MTFAELGLSPETLKAIEALGYETPTPIQEQAIPILLEGSKDFIGLASTGTGKTAAFGLPLLERMDPNNPLPQGIILSPTRELCLQITEDLKKYCRGNAASGYGRLRGIQYLHSDSRSETGYPDYRCKRRVVWSI